MTKDQDLGPFCTAFLGRLTGNMIESGGTEARIVPLIRNVSILSSGLICCAITVDSSYLLLNIFIIIEQLGNKVFFFSSAIRDPFLS